MSPRWGFLWDGGGGPRTHGLRRGLLSVAACAAGVENEGAFDFQGRPTLRVGARLGWLIWVRVGAEDGDGEGRRDAYRSSTTFTSIGFSWLSMDVWATREGNEN